MNLADLLVLGALLLGVCLAVRRLRRGRGGGCSGCNGNCASCHVRRNSRRSGSR